MVARSNGRRANWTTCLASRGWWATGAEPVAGTRLPKERKDVTAGLSIAFLPSFLSSLEGTMMPFLFLGCPTPSSLCCLWILLLA